MWGAEVTEGTETGCESNFKWYSTAAKDTVQGHHLVSTDEAKKAPRGYMTDSRSQEKWKPNTPRSQRTWKPNRKQNFPSRQTSVLLILPTQLQCPRCDFLLSEGNSTSFLGLIPCLSGFPTLHCAVKGGQTWQNKSRHTLVCNMHAAPSCAGIGAPLPLHMALLHPHHRLLCPSSSPPAEILSILQG